MSAPIFYQRMNTGLYVPTQPGTRPPLISVVSAQAHGIEGNPLLFQIFRNRNITSSCSIGWRVESQAGLDDFAGAVSGRVEFQASYNTNVADVVINTIRRSGNQGTRIINLILENPTDCEIDGSNSRAGCDLSDYVPAGTKWWKDKTLRSGGSWAHGPGYFKQDWQTYPQQVALPDAITDSNFGDRDAKIATKQLCYGGPEMAFDTITAGSQFAWGGTSSGWNITWNQQLSVPTWNGFVLDLLSREYNTDPNDDAYNGQAVWTDMKNGVFDNWFKGVGRRIKINYEEKGRDMKYFLGRNFHEMQQSNFYRIIVAQKSNWKQANERMYDKIREGAGYDLKFGFSPAKENFSVDGNLGALSTWCPNNVDFITPSFHPGKECKTKSDYMKYINGQQKWYGLNDFASFMYGMDKPIAFLEWSPRFQNCTIADQIYQWFYDEWLVPNKDWILCETVFEEGTLNPAKADNQADQTAEGKAAWRRGVNVFKTKWGGIKGPK